MITSTDPIPQAVSGNDACELRKQALALLVTAPRTPDEIASLLGRSVLAVRPRLTELRKLGCCNPTGESRPSSLGHSQQVLSARPGASDILATAHASPRRGFVPPIVVRGSAAPLPAKQPYVCGFLFDSMSKWVALILKQTGPECLKGKWNGIDGKVEPGETFAAAMRREFREEAGLDIHSWTPFAHMVSDNCEIQYFFAHSPAMSHVRTMEKEVVSPWPVEGLPGRTCPNLSWMLPLALSPDREDFLFPFTSRELR